MNDLTPRARVRDCLTRAEMSAGDYAEAMLAQFGAWIDDPGEVGVGHLSDRDVRDLIATARRCGVEI